MTSLRATLQAEPKVRYASRRAFFRNCRQVCQKIYVCPQASWGDPRAKRESDLKGMERSHQLLELSRGRMLVVHRPRTLGDGI